MRRLLGFILLASAVPVLFSCTEENVFTPKSQMREMVITATREADEPETKTELVNGKTYWSVGDKISVFFGSGTAGGAEFSSLNTEPAASADFTGILTAVTGSEDGSTGVKYFWGVYPYSEQNSLALSGDSNILTTTVNSFQEGVADSYSPGQNIWIGRSQGLELSFKTLLSGLKFTFSRGDITKVIIKGNNSEPLAGKVNVTMDSGVPVVSSVVSGTTSITLTPQGRDTFLSGPVYRALFLPTNFTQGLTVTFFTADGSVGRRTFRANNYERNAPKNATNADESATFVTPEPVDMGNGLLMAPWNVGATSPDETGDYFAWGETSSKTNYDWETYKWGRDASSIIRYVTDPSYGTPDYRMYLTDADDAATKNWGPSWRTPTDTEWSTLLDTDKYTWTWTTNYNGTGATGYTVTSKSTNNSIFLRAAGYSSGIRLINKTQGYYWSSTGSDINENAIQLGFSNSSHAISGGNLADRRMRGKSVRPIYAPRKPVENIVYPAEEMDIVDNGKPKNAYAILEPVDAFDRGLHVYTTDPSVIQVDASLHNYIKVEPEGSTIPLTVNGPGTTEMIFETPDHSVSFTMIINVESTVTGITLNKTSHTFSNYLENLTPLQLIATVSPSTASQLVYWRSSDESVATVDYDGKVTPVGNGTATISAMKGSVTATCNVTVDIWKHVTSFSWWNNVSYDTFPANSSFGLAPIISPSDAHDKTITWSVSDSYVARVNNTPNSYGEYMVTTLKPGICEITGTTNDGAISMKYIVTVVSSYMSNPLYSGKYMGYVDMGYGYKIASVNVGAENAWDYGSYFEWADTRPTVASSPWLAYKYFGGWEKQGYPDSQSSMWLPKMTKYVANPASAFNYSNSSIDGKTVLESSDDPASTLWGSYWRSPTGLEWQAILEICTVEERSVNGVSGAMLTSKSNGAAVFIPYGGYDKDDMGYMSEEGQSAFLWGSTIGTRPNGSLTGHPEEADYVKISGSDSSSSKGTTERRCALNVRAIHKD